MQNTTQFDELTFFAEVKKRPGMYFGVPSLHSLRDLLLGMEYAFSFCCHETPLRYFRSFVSWYQNEMIADRNGYACWWNHLLYTCGNDDRYAFDSFFVVFEQYLLEAHHVSLPSVSS